MKKIEKLLRSIVRFEKNSSELAVFFILTFMVSLAVATTVYVDPVGGILHNGGGPQLNGGASPGYHHSLSVTSSYVNASQTGLYWLETSWGVHSSHDTNVSYAVNGTTCLAVDQRKDVAGAAVSGKWSGFKALNNGGWGILYLTNGVSELTSIAGGGSVHTRGLWRATRLTGTFINPNTFGKSSVSSSAPGNGSYYYTTLATNCFSIGTKLVPGTYRLDISWGVHGTHSSDVTCSYNLTGAGGFAGATDVLFNVDQRAMNDGRAFENLSFGFNTWSGFRELGIFAIEPGSQIWLRGNGTLTMGVIQATPLEPACYIDPPDGTVYAKASIGGPVMNGGTVQRYTYDTMPCSSWITHNTNGYYWIEVSWGVYSTHNTSVSYRVGDVTYLTGINQTKDALGGADSGTWSGFKALNHTGTNGIHLTAQESAITAVSNGTGALSRGLWRVSPITGILVNPTSFGEAASTSSSPGNGHYYVASAAPGVCNIGSILPKGYYRLDISWGVDSGNCSDVTYLYNRTGVGGCGSARSIFAGIDQRKMNDGRYFAKPASFQSGTWSGFKELGVFQVEAGTQIWVDGVGTLTMGVIQATPVSPPVPQGSVISLR
jgi:hypothetical protein